jgi:hypothetical protein
MPTERRERRLCKRSVAKDGNKAKKARRGGKAGSGTEEGRVSVAPTIDTAAATVAVPETVAAETEAVEKEGSLVAPETAEAEKEGSLAAVSEVVEKEKERSLASEMVVVDKEVDAGAFMFFSGAVFLMSVCYTAYTLYNHFI